MLDSAKEYYLEKAQILKHMCQNEDCRDCQFFDKNCKIGIPCNWKIKKPGNI